ncbi:amphi-Trp domain-containing protein [Streptomyces glaucescens]|uniref:amphi-Trp domain-containing protein n=1 Tax=Streptomyces glaucescens TaxID=1907 RepID=UPI000A3C0EE2|nr:amphi-Trp domain-containing protein [Streptomyces glaucescens]
MKDVKFEHKRSLSRTEAADQLAALAQALREGGEAELELGSGVLSLRIPDELSSEVELEVGDGEVQLEVELTWPAGRASAAAAPAAAATKEPESAPAEPAAKSARSRKTAAATRTRRSTAKRA